MAIKCRRPRRPRLWQSEKTMRDRRGGRARPRQQDFVRGVRQDRMSGRVTMSGHARKSIAAIARRVATMPIMTTIKQA